MFKKLLAVLPFILLLSYINTIGQTKAESFITNPITSGFYADPCIVKDGNTYFIYATTDPWGGNELGVLETKDFKHFKQHHLNWPTKKSCTSPTSQKNMVWAPSVRKASNGKYYM